MKNFMLKSFADGVAAHPEWEGKLKLLEQVFLTCTMPEDKEIELMSQLFNLQLMITYDASAQPVGRVGHASWPKVMLSNAPVFDGAGESAAHFRYVWTCPTQADPVQEAMASCNHVNEAFYHHTVSTSKCVKVEFMVLLYILAVTFIYIYICRFQTGP